MSNNTEHDRLYDKFLITQVKKYPHIHNKRLRYTEEKKFTLEVTDELTQRDDIKPLVKCLEQYGIEWRIKITEVMNDDVYFVIVREPIKWEIDS